MDNRLEVSLGAIIAPLSLRPIVISKVSLSPYNADSRVMHSVRRTEFSFVTVCVLGHPDPFSPTHDWVCEVLHTPVARWLFLEQHLW